MATHSYGQHSRGRGFGKPYAQRTLFGAFFVISLLVYLNIQEQVFHRFNRGQSLHFLACEVYIIYVIIKIVLGCPPIEGFFGAHKCAIMTQDMSMKKITYIMTVLLLSLLAFGTPASAQHCDARKGDSMWKIAKRYKIPFAKILILNKHYPNQNLIHPEDNIEMPDGQSGQSTEKDNAGAGTETADHVDATQQAREVLQLVNRERAKAGVKPLTLSDSLTNIATVKAQDMADKGYFDHNSPTYGSPFDMMRRFGEQYSSAGENIAAGQKDAKEVMDSWMNSSGHRANILNADYEQIGIGYVEGGRWGTYWVQLFKK